MIIGLVGGVASGKSFVARMLARLTNGRVVDADAIAREKLSDQIVLRTIRERFGPAVVDPNGRLDRKKLAHQVFGTAPEHIQNRKWLNELIHPLVHAEVSDIIANTLANDSKTWIILDVPLLLEAGWRNECDRVVFVDSNKETRENFARKRGWSEGELQRREESQLPLAEKRIRATDIIINSGCEQELEKALVDWLKTL